MKAKTNDEFEIEAFAKYYDELSDSFIDIRKASDSLKSQIVAEMGGKVTISDDLEWIILERVYEN